MKDAELTGRFESPLCENYFNIQYVALFLKESLLNWFFFLLPNGCWQKPKIPRKMRKIWLNRVEYYRHILYRLNYRIVFRRRKLKKKEKKLLFFRLSYIIFPFFPRGRKYFFHFSSRLRGFWHDTHKQLFGPLMNQILDLKNSPSFFMHSFSHAWSHVSHTKTWKNESHAKAADPAVWPCQHITHKNFLLSPVNSDNFIYEWVCGKDRTKTRLDNEHLKQFLVHKDFDIGKF